MMKYFVTFENYLKETFEPRRVDDRKNDPKAKIAKSMIEYGELEWKMDKYMPDEEDLQQEYHDILDDMELSEVNKKQQLIDFFYSNADTERMYRYMPEGGTLEGYVQYLIDQV